MLLFITSTKEKSWLLRTSYNKKLLVNRSLLGVAKIDYGESGGIRTLDTLLKRQML